MKRAHSWKVVFLNIHECKASLMKLALKYNEMNILEHSWKVVFFNIHECIKPEIIKNPWNKYTDQGCEKSKTQKAMVPKLISKDCWPHLYWYGLWAFVKVNKHLWSNSPICETAIPYVVACLSYARVSTPFPYLKCHNVELVVILFPSLLNF